MATRWLLLLCPAALGCGEELGATRKPTTAVSGSVQIGRRPVGAGWIVFQPIDGTVGDLYAAPLRPDGSFHASGVAVGTNQVRIEHPEVRLPLPSPADPRIRFESPTSPIRRDVRPGEPIVIDLASERIDGAHVQDRQDLGIGEDHAP